MTNTDTRFGIGGNRPPSITPDQIQLDNAHLFDSLSELEVKAAAVPDRIDDDATCGVWSDVSKAISGLDKSFEATRVATKEPHLIDCRTIDAAFLAPRKRCAIASAPVDRAVFDYLRRKRDAERARLEAEARKAREAEAKARQEAREAQERAERLAERNRPAQAEIQLERAALARSEAIAARGDAHLAQAAAAASSADLSRTRSEEGGSLATLADAWGFDITDFTALPPLELWPYIPAKAREAAVRAFVRAGGRKLQGARIFAVDKLNVR